ncbi:hypothetical protein EGW08_013740 [Elysia chlorotica]|uniref:Uncharacterized protein n=1 Tax=Elysia chlorotica TaxID=188477 RepID=A0A433TA69_ELYCH|nr:hypothetical protein EGW08_013740 [Elysia chlorotica]
MEANAVTVSKLETNRQLSTQPKEIGSRSESPSDAGRLIVPLEDLDRVDGIRPSSSRTRAVALLPAIEESVEEGPEASHLDKPGAQNVLWGRRTSSKPMLTSISEERIPRMWEYPLGGRAWERTRSPGRALGAGEAPTIQPHREQSSPGAFEKNPDGDIGLVEAGDAETREGNRSNHALCGWDSEHGYKEEEEDDDQNIPQIDFSTTGPSGEVEVNEHQNADGASVLENNVSSSENSSHGVETVVELGASSEATPLHVADENNAKQSEKELAKVETCANAPVLVEEINVEKVVGSGNTAVKSLEVCCDIGTREESHESNDESSADTSHVCVDGGEGEIRGLEPVNRDGSGPHCGDFKDESLHISSSGIACDFARQGNVDGTDMEIKTSVPSEHFGGAAVEEISISWVADGSCNKTMEVDQERKFVGGDTFLTADSAACIEEKSDTIPHLEGEDKILISLDNLEVDQDRVVWSEGENSASQVTTAAVEEIGNEDNEGKMVVQLNSPESPSESKCPLKDLTTSDAVVPPIPSQEETGADEANSIAINKDQSEITHGGLDQGINECGKDSRLCVEGSTHNGSCEDSHDMYVIGDAGELRSLSSQFLISDSCVNENQDLAVAETIVNGTSSQEDSMVSSSGSNRAKGSGSDSMVAEGTVSVAEITGARESHSDHTSGSDKVDQAAKAKDGSAKPRGRERERTKRKRADREDREDRAGSPGGKQKSLKNAVGDVQAENEDAGEVTVEDTLQVKVKNTPAQELVVRECRTIRATSSGDVRDAAVKSTCGLESQTVTSIDDSQSETESGGVWEQEQMLDDWDNSGRCHTPPKGIPASRFGKRTQVHRQKQGSPQEQPILPLDTEKTSPHTIEQGLGDTERGSVSKTISSQFASVDNAAWAVQRNGASCAHDESCNNPRDPISSTASSDSHLQSEVDTHVDQTSLDYPQILAMSGSDVDVQRDFEHQTADHRPNRLSSSTLIQTQTNGPNNSQSSHEIQINDFDSCAELKERCALLASSSSSGENSVRIDDEKVLDPQCNKTEAASSDQADIPIDTESKIEALYKISYILKDAKPENLDCPLNSAGNNTECKSEDGASCCTLDRRNTVATISTLPTTSDDLSEDHESSSGNSASTTKTEVSSKSGKSSIRGTKKPSSNFDSLFPPMMCAGGKCFLEKQDPNKDFEDNIHVAMLSLSQSSSATDEYIQGIQSNNENVQSDISETTDSCNTSQEPGVQGSISSTDIHYSNYRNALPVSCLDDDLVISDVDRKVAEDASGDQPEVLKEQDGAAKGIQWQLPQDPRADDDIGAQKKKTLQDEGEEYQSEGLFIPHTGAYGDDFETALVSALAEAAQDSSPPVPRKNPPREDISTLTIGKKDSVLNTGDQIRTSEKEKETYNEDSPPMQHTQHILNEMSYTTSIPSLTFQVGIDNEKEEISENSVSESNSSKINSEIFKASVDSEIETTAQTTTCTGDQSGSREHEPNQCEKAEHVANLPGDSCLAIDNAGHSEHKSERSHEESNEEALYELGLNTVCKVKEEEETQPQVLDHDIVLNEGDFPVADKVPENVEIRKECENVSHDFLEGQENKPTVDHYVVAVAQHTAPLTSPFPQRRPNTPVAGDGDCVEKRDIDTKVQAEPIDFEEQVETKRLENAENCETVGVDLKSTILEQQMVTGEDLYLRDDGKSMIAKPSYEKPDSQSISEYTKDTAKYANVNSPSSEQNHETVIPDVDIKGGESKKNSEISVGKNAMGTREGGENCETSQLCSDFAVDKTEKEINEADIEQTNAKYNIEHGREINEIETSVNEKISEEAIPQVTETDGVWADTVIGEFDKVCDNYQKTFQMDCESEEGVLCETAVYKDDQISPEELPKEPTLYQSHDQAEYNKKSLLKKLEEHDLEITGRSKDGGKRAKRSKPCCKQKNQTGEDQPFVSEAQVRRINLVDVANFPQDKPSVYHPDRAEAGGKRETTFTASAIARSGGKRVTIWRRLKTIFHPRRGLPKETSAKPGQSCSTDERPARQTPDVTSVPAPIRLRQPAMSENTLGLHQGQLVRDAPKGPSETWPGAPQKTKARPPRQWRRLKKFRALRRGAERQKGRLPPTLRQVVSKSNYVRAAEGDNPSTGGKRKSSSDLPLVNQTNLLGKKELASRSTPEVAKVLVEESILAEGQYAPAQPSVRAILKPVASHDSDGSSTRHPDGIKEARQCNQPCHEELQRARSVFRNRDTGEAGKEQQLGKERKKANTYQGNNQSRISAGLSKDKANTYQRTLETSDKASKNCLLM